jgi:hypothetical protein
VGLQAAFLLSAGMVTVALLATLLSSSVRNLGSRTAPEPQTSG